MSRHCSRMSLQCSSESLHRSWVALHTQLQEDPVKVRIGLFHPHTRTVKNRKAGTIKYLPDFLCAGSGGFSASHDGRFFRFSPDTWPPARLEPWGEAGDEAGGLGGPPLSGGTAGTTSVPPRCGLSRSTVAISFFLPTATRKIWSPLSRTRKGPEQSGSRGGSWPPRWM